MLIINVKCPFGNASWCWIVYKYPFPLCSCYARAVRHVASPVPSRLLPKSNEEGNRTHQQLHPWDAWLSRAQGVKMMSRGRTESCRTVPGSALKKNHWLFCYPSHLIIHPAFPHPLFISLIYRFSLFPTFSLSKAFFHIPSSYSSILSPDLYRPPLFFPLLHLLWFPRHVSPLLPCYLSSGCGLFHI